MRTYTLIPFLLSHLMLILACTSQSKPKNTSMETTGDNSRNSLDWDGIYRGVTPCADCMGIQKTIFINKDLTYRVKVKYLGKDSTATEYAGKIAWNEKGNAIELTEGQQSQAYAVGENALTQLDQSGNKITGDLAHRYVFTKQNYAILEKYWKLTELNGKPVLIDSASRNEPHIIFKDEEGRFVGNGGCNSFSGNFELDSRNKITMSKAIVTQMACTNMEIESQLLRVLQMADNYILNADTLILNKARMAPLARFKVVYTR
ncbi:copper resistance protein NlpE N-terminal domain-containing protein [Flavitalea antarctica]